ncbi:hypothetical protein C6B37_02135 [Candidatus Phytoplasma phoenicium]|uniref:Uncharacterized protein n=1 Tax=Candidatus Phytoplasma phoenicium TaxID=198422 RepID=A0A2S8NTH6_9MOLU|nr:hypothetical protein C6B37_02135 [Candidatus Phytoplasma phoenicium]
MNYQIQLTNIPIQVKVRYKKQDNYKILREWFITNFNLTHNNKNYNWDEIIIIFEHIDADNPEFFLQPGQLIKIIDGLLIIKKEQEIPILKVYSFQQLKDETD